MRYVDLGQARASVIGLGTWQFGSREWNYGSHYADDTAKRIIERALELGVNLIDTAEMYGFGASERIIGSVLAQVPSGAVIASKIVPFTYSPGYVTSRCTKSRRRLGVEAIDLYQVHFPNPVDRLDRLAGALDALVDRGMVRSVGVSNFSVAAWDRLGGMAKAPIVSNQVHYSLLERRPEAEHLPYALANSKVVIAYSPIEQGVLSGKYGRSNRPRDIRRMNRNFAPDSLERMQPLLAALGRIAKAHDATSAQIALAWVVSHPNVIAIPGASSVAQLEANAAAADIELGREEVAELEAASDLYRDSAGNRALRAMRTRIGI